MLAAEQINAAGGIRGLPLVIVIEDNGGSSQLALSSVQKFLNVHEVDAVFSAFTHITQAIKGVIASFPGGVCRSGSKTGSLKYSKFMKASTNHLECPALKDKVEGSKVPADANCVLELVFNAISEDLLKQATAVGIKEIAKTPGIKKISAGNFGGTLGKVQIHLKEALSL